VHWQADGQPRPDLDGCIDIDIDCTPLTNTLPIRRLSWAPGATHDLSVAFVSVPDLTVRAVSQRYTLVEPRLYWYQSGAFRAFRAFRADLPVDGDGFVLDYPGFWARLGGRGLPRRRDPQVPAGRRRTTAGLPRCS
jgi:uncharacterized protein